MTVRRLRLLMFVLVAIGTTVLITERALAVQVGVPSRGRPSPQPQCEEVLGLTITSVMNGNRLETQTFTGSELTPRHPIAAGARYNSGTGRWEDPNNPNNYVTFAPDIRLSHRTCSGQSPQFGGQELSHNTMPVDPGHSVDISVTVTCSNCNRQRLTAQFPVDTVAGASQPVVIQPPPPIDPPPPVIWRPTPIALTATPQCTSGRSTIQLAWQGGQGASTVTVWRGGPNAGSAGGWDRLQTYSGQEAILNVFVDTTVTAGQQYQYTIEALAYSGQQALSPNIPAAATTCTQPPPSSFTLTVTTVCTERDQRVATLGWETVPTVTSYIVLAREGGAEPGFAVPITVGPDTTSTTVPLRADTIWQVFAFTPTGVVRSNEVSQLYEQCQPPVLPPTIAASGTARFSVSGLPAGASWDRLRFPELMLNGGGVTASIEGRIPSADPDSSGLAPSVSLFELTNTNATIDLGQVPSLARADAFTLILALSSDPTQQQTPRIPKIVVTATPPPPPPAPTVRLTATAADDATTFELNNTGHPGSIELANAAPFTVSTPTGETVYAPIATTEVITLAAGQTRSWRWDYRQTDGTPVERPGQFVVTLTYGFAGQERRIETEFVASRNPDDGSTFDVSRYGAACDGTTDDTAAIGRAIDAAITAHGGVVVFPAGKTCQLLGVVRSGNNVTLDGNNVTLRSGLTLDNPAPVLGLNGSGNVIENFTIDYAQAIDIGAGRNAGTRGSTLWLGSNGGNEPYASGATVTNNTIRNAPGNCLMVTFAHDVLIKDNQCEGALASGIFTGNLGDRILIEGNTVSDTGDDGIFAETGQYAPQPQHELTIRNNTVTRSNAKGIGLSGARVPIIANNTVDGTAGSGIVIESDDTQSPVGVEGARIRGNTLRNIGQFNDHRSEPLGDRHGIRVVVPRYRVKDLAIVNNTLEHVVMNGIAVNGVENLTIEANRLSDIDASGVSLGFDRAEDSLAVDGYTITENTLEDLQLNGIYLSKVTNGTITGNHVSDYGKAGRGYGDAAIFFYHADTATHRDNVINNTQQTPFEVKVVESTNLRGPDSPVTGQTPPTPTLSSGTLTVKPTGGAAPLTVTVAFSDPATDQRLAINYNDLSPWQNYTAGTTARHLYRSSGEYDVQILNLNDVCKVAGCNILASQTVTVAPEPQKTNPFTQAWQWLTGLVGLGGDGEEPTPTPSNPGPEQVQVVEEPITPQAQPPTELTPTPVEVRAADPTPTPVTTTGDIATPEVPAAPVTATKPEANEPAEEKPSSGQRLPGQVFQALETPKDDGSGQPARSDTRSISGGAPTSSASGSSSSGSSSTSDTSSGSSASPSSSSTTPSASSSSNSSASSEPTSTSTSADRPDSLATTGSNGDVTNSTETQSSEIFVRFWDWLLRLFQLN